MTVSKTPKVELRINVLQDEAAREPEVLRATKRHLVCDYGGLVFKQPRERSPAENQPGNVKQSRKLVETTIKKACMKNAKAISEEATPLPEPPMPDSSKSDKDHVPVLFASWIKEAAQRTTEIQVADTLREITWRICEDSASAQFMLFQNRGTQVAQLGAAPAEEVEQADYQVDLEARKAGLMARLKAYEKEIADWRNLLSEAKHYSSELRNALPDVHSPESDAAEPADIAELKQMHADLHRHLTMQAEGLYKLVVDVEGLVNRANQTAQTLQADYHQEKFRAFPHVDSPARLIKALVKPLPN